MVRSRSQRVRGGAGSTAAKHAKVRLKVLASFCCVQQLDADARKARGVFLLQARSTACRRGSLGLKADMISSNSCCALGRLSLE